MPLPDDLTTIKVTGSFPNIAGQSQTGHVVFDPGQPVEDSTGSVTLTGPVTVQVFNGVMQPVVLPCTDNDGLNPTGFAYTVTESINGLVRSYQVALPSTLGASVDLSSLTPVTDPVTAQTLTGDNTWTGNQEFDGGIKIPSGAADGDVLTSDADGNATWQAAPGGGSGDGLTNPMSAVGDMIYGASAGVGERLPGNTSATKKYLSQTGTGSAGAEPVWGTIQAADVPALSYDASGAAATAQSNAEAYTDTETTRAETAEALKLAKASNLSDLANAGTARTNLGLGTAATHASTDFDSAGAATSAQSAAEAASLPITGGTMTGELSPSVEPLTFGSTILVNADLANVFAVTLTASTGTLGNPSNPVDGQTIRVRVIQDETGGWTLAYGTAYNFGAASAPTLSADANKVDILGFEYVASLSKWCYLGAGLGF